MSDKKWKLQVVWKDRKFRIFANPSLRLSELQKVISNHALITYKDEIAPKIDRFQDEDSCDLSEEFIVKDVFHENGSVRVVSHGGFVPRTDTTTAGSDPGVTSTSPDPSAPSATKHAPKGAKSTPQPKQQKRDPTSSTPKLTSASTPQPHGHQSTPRLPHVSVSVSDNGDSSDDLGTELVPDSPSVQPSQFLPQSSSSVTSRSASNKPPAKSAPATLTPTTKPGSSKKKPLHQQQSTAAASSPAPLTPGSSLVDKTQSVRPTDLVSVGADEDLAIKAMTQIAIFGSTSNNPLADLDSPINSDSDISNSSLSDDESTSSNDDASDTALLAAPIIPKSPRKSLLSAEKTSLVTPMRRAAAAPASGSASQPQTLLLEPATESKHTPADARRASLAPAAEGKKPTAAEKRRASSVEADVLDKAAESRETKKPRLDAAEKTSGGGTLDSVESEDPVQSLKKTHAPVIKDILRALPQYVKFVDTKRVIQDVNRIKKEKNALKSAPLATLIKELFNEVLEERQAAERNANVAAASAAPMEIVEKNAKKGKKAQQHSAPPVGSDAMVVDSTSDRDAADDVLTVPESFSMLLPGSQNEFVPMSDEEKKEGGDNNKASGSGRGSISSSISSSSSDSDSDNDSDNDSEGGDDDGDGEDKGKSATSASAKPASEAPGAKRKRIQLASSSSEDESRPMATTAAAIKPAPVKAAPAKAPATKPQPPAAKTVPKSTSASGAESQKASASQQGKTANASALASDSNSDSSDSSDSDSGEDDSVSESDARMQQSRQASKKPSHSQIASSSSSSSSNESSDDADSSEESEEEGDKKKDEDKTQTPGGSQSSNGKAAKLSDLLSMKVARSTVRNYDFSSDEEEDNNDQSSQAQGRKQQGTAAATTGGAVRKGGDSESTSDSDSSSDSDSDSESDSSGSSASDAGNAQKSKKAPKKAPKRLQLALHLPAESDPFVSPAPVPALSKAKAGGNGKAGSQPGSTTKAAGRNGGDKVFSPSGRKLPTGTIIKPVTSQDLSNAFKQRGVIPSSPGGSLPVSPMPTPSPRVKNRAARAQPIPLVLDDSKKQWNAAQLLDIVNSNDLWENERD